MDVGVCMCCKLHGKSRPLDTQFRPKKIIGLQFAIVVLQFH